MSSRNGRESLLGARNFAAGSMLQLQHHRRGHSLNGISKDSGDNLDLFSKSRRTLSVASSDESSDVSVKFGGLSVGSAKLARSGIDDLLSFTDGGKHDYDWLMTPPETPACPSSEGESQPTLAPPRRSRSTSTSKASRLSVSQSENNGHSRPARSSSVTRPSISSSQYSYNAYSSNRSSSILNTSSASVSSYTRPSSPLTRSSSSASRPSTPTTSRPTTSRPSTPSKVRSAPTEKSKPSQSLRPSTPSSRPHITSNLLSSSVSSSARSLSRPSTPTRRNSAPAPSTTTISSTSSGRISLNGSRPSSPNPRCRPAPQPIVPPDFPLETPPNLRTTLPDRPVSAGRSRPGASVTLKANSESQPSVINMPRRQPSPIVTRGRLTEAAGRSRGLANANGHHADVPEPRKVPQAPEVVARKSVKTSTTTSIDSSGFGRTISKKSLDMAIKHMDIKNSSGNLRSLSSTLFPQSVRTSTPKSVRGLSGPASVNMNGSLQSSNNVANFEPMENRSVVDERQYSAKLSEVDIYESSRYDTILLKEDLKNTNWLLSADDKCDQGPIFDNGFESLPEPFGLL